MRVRLAATLTDDEFEEPRPAGGNQAQTQGGLKRAPGRILFLMEVKGGGGGGGAVYLPQMMTRKESNSLIMEKVVWCVEGGVGRAL